MKAPDAWVAADRLGRFELRRPLGQGAQATVWLAHDSRFGRDVAVKLLRRGDDALAAGQALDEARAISRLSHPNIVPLFEADEVDGQSYLVFEFVDGSTLAESRRGKGALGAREAVTLMLAVLDAVVVAHEHGIVHRDLKPSNILLDRNGRPRVMDFGVAAAVDRGADGIVVGTPGFMSPEAAQGAAPTPGMDVFAAGMLLGGLVAGRPLLVESDVARALERVQREDFALPDEAVADAELRTIVARALARDSGRRYADAKALRQALAAWLTPTDLPVAPGASAAGQGTLDFLLRRMRHKRDFPALSEAVTRIQRVTSSESESLANLSAEILKDVALTNKLLRMVNTVHFNHAGAGSISTVSRAVALVGFAGIRNMALSVVLLERMEDRAHAALIRDEFLRAMLAGTVASELTPQSRESEEAFIGAMFQNLGRLLTEYYFPEEARQIKQLVGSGSAPAMSYEQAARRVLGLDFSELGLGVARSWGLPASLQRMMSAPTGAVPRHRVVSGVEYLGWVGRAANQIADEVLKPGAAKVVQGRVRAAIERFAPALGVGADDLVDSVASARQRMGQLVHALGLGASGAAAALALPQDSATAPADLVREHPLMPTATLGQAGGSDAPQPGAGASAADILAAGIQDITNSMVLDDFSLNQVLRMVLETMWRALGFWHIAFCLRDARSEALTGRFGFGPKVDVLCDRFRVSLKSTGGAPDLLSAVAIKGIDTLIADARQPNIAARLPAWFHDEVRAGAFLVLPLAVKGVTIGLIYADCEKAGGIELGEKELALLRTLRNQAIMAIRQADRT